MFSCRTELPAIKANGESSCESKAVEQVEEKRKVESVIWRDDKFADSLSLNNDISTLSSLKVRISIKGKPRKVK